VNAFEFNTRRTARTSAAGEVSGMRKVICHSSRRTVFGMSGPRVLRK